MTRTVKDCAFILNEVAGEDPNDNTTIDSSKQDFLSNIDAGIEGKKIGLIKEMTADGIDSSVLSATKDAVSRVRLELLVQLDNQIF